MRTEPDYVDQIIADVRARKAGTAPKPAVSHGGAKLTARRPATLTPRLNRAQRRARRRTGVDAEGYFALFGRPMANRPRRPRHASGRRPRPAQVALVQAVNAARLRRGIAEPLDPRRHIDQAVRRARHLGLAAELEAAGYKAKAVNR